MVEMDSLLLGLSQSSLSWRDMTRMSFVGDVMGRCSNRETTSCNMQLSQRIALFFHGNIALGKCQIYKMWGTGPTNIP